MQQLILFVSAILAVRAQQECYYQAGAPFRGPSNLVPCSNNGESSCCLLGDVCLAGGACWNELTGDTYQYGCTDVTYTDASCPQKCGWNATLSPWAALEFCKDLSGVSNTWICQSPETCGCDWDPSFALQYLPPQGCQAMGSLARVAFYASSTLAPYASLPRTIGGATGYYSPVMSSGSILTWSGPSTQYSSNGPLTSYRTPNGVLQLDPSATPVQTTIRAAHLPSASSNIITQTLSSISTTALPSTSPASTPISSVSSTSAAPSSSSSVPSAASTSSGLSTGAKVGIGVGIGGAVCVLALFGVIIYLCGKLRRKRKSERSEQQHFNPDGAHHPPHSPPPLGAQYGQYPFQAYHDNMHGYLQHHGHMSQGSMSPPSLAGLNMSPEQKFAHPEFAGPLAELGAERRVHELDSEESKT